MEIIMPAEEFEKLVRDFREVLAWYFEDDSGDKKKMARVLVTIKKEPSRRMV